MRKTRVVVCVHAVWSTWDRAPILTTTLLPQIHAAIAANSRALGCEPVHVGVVTDHVHLLVALQATLTVAQLVGQCKGASSHLVNHRLTIGQDFRWKGAYAAFSVGGDCVAEVATYVRDQASRHANLRLLADLEPDA